MFLTEASRELRSQIQEKYHRTVEVNQKKMKLRCSEIQHRAEVSSVREGGGVLEANIHNLPFIKERSEEN